MTNEDKHEISRVDQIIEATQISNQYILLFSLLSVAAFIEGFVHITNVLVSPIIEHSWRLGSVFKGFMMTSYFSGLIVSAFIINWVNKKGRKNALILANLKCLVGSVMLIYSTTALHLITSNFIIGIGVGSLMITSTSLASEISSKAYRSFAFTWIWLFFPIGEIFGCFLSETFNVYAKQSSNWCKVIQIYPLIVAF